MFFILFIYLLCDRDWETVSEKNQNAVVVSHLNESTKAIFGMVRNFYDNLPNPAVTPDLKESMK